MFYSALHWCRCVICSSKKSVFILSDTGPQCSAWFIETCCYQCQQRCGTASSVSPASAAERVEVKDMHIISLHCVCAYFVFDKCFMHLPFLYLQTIKVICVLPVQSAIFKLRAIFHLLQQIFSTKLKNRISPTESPDTTNPHKDRMSSLLLFVGS